MIRRAGALVLALVAGGLLALPSASASAAVTLMPCMVLPHARCGTIERPWEPGDPAAGTVTVGFAFVPARDTSKPALGTVVPHEGGPGYSTTGTAAAYAAMYGPLLPTLEKVLDVVRGKPWRDTAYDADGRRMKVTIDPPGLAAVAFGATYTPAFYRELTAALRSGLSGDRRPLLRLVAEATGGDTDAGPVGDYSEGLDAAVACHDYPQLYDMTAAPGVRQQQYAAALSARSVSDPDTYGPFTVPEYAASDWQSLDWCTQWPSAPASNPAGPPVPPGGRYPSVPVLVLSGELDSITTPAEGALVTSQLPGARQVTIANSVHVTAVGDKDDCAVRIVRSFVRSPTARLPTRCAGRVPPVRALASFPRPLPPHPSARALARSAALTVADLQDRWWSNYSGHGVGLRGGTWRYAGDDVVRFRLSGVRLVGGLPVSGRATWDRLAETMPVSLDLPSGHLDGRWDTRTLGARASLSDRLHGHPVRISFPAP